mgnify:CR=1 FL=1|tara:strand:+ start:242 stop:463 length:222 start_codon:yes stop_codon:yes gene_type:complete
MEKQMSVGDWLITYLVTCIPLIGFIMLFVWAFGDGNQQSKKTWAQATLLWIVIVFFLSVFFFGIASSMLSSFY